MVSNGMKKCPYCAELIKEEAIKCKHCGSDLTHNPDSTVSQKRMMNILKKQGVRLGFFKAKPLRRFFLPGEREWRHYAN